MPSSGASPSGEPDGDAVVGPDRLDVEPEVLLEPSLDGERPRRVDPPAERRQQTQPPIAELIAEPLQDDSPVGRQGAGRLAFVVEIREQVGGSAIVEVVRLLEPCRRRGPTLWRHEPGPPPSRG